MSDVPSPLYRLNFPVETELAYKFWGSRHRANNCKAIIAFSLSIPNANDNLRRYGYAREFRERALKNYCMYVNMPSMEGIPFSEMEQPWWEEMPYRRFSLCEIPQERFWHDTDNWDDTRDWVEGE